MTTPHPALPALAAVARNAFAAAAQQHERSTLAQHDGQGADGTPTMRIDRIVEDAVLNEAARFDVNILSEEAGWIDNGSVATIIIDPVDGSANAAAGVPLSCFSATLAVDGDFTEALTASFHGVDRWHTIDGHTTTMRTSGRQQLDGAAISLLRPHPHNIDSWWKIAQRAGRIRVLGCSTLDAALVATGAIDGFADALSDTHRLMDIAAACVHVPAAGGAVMDARGRPIELDTDLTRRWSGVVAATERLAQQICQQLAE